MESNVLFNRASNNEDSDDVWDDSALIRAYDKAVNKIKNDLTKNKDTGDKKEKKKSGKENKRSEFKEKKQQQKEQQVESEWKVGDHCIAVYAEDGLAYPGVIIDINGNSCRVRYDYYENEEDKLLEELYPTTTSEEKQEEPKVEAKKTTKVKPKQSSAKQEHQPSQQDLPGLNFPIPPPPPPLPASLISHFQNLNLNEDSDGSLDDKEAFYSMLMSWYMSGYHTGYYFGLTQQRQKE